MVHVYKLTTMIEGITEDNVDDEEEDVVEDNRVLK